MQALRDAAVLAFMHSLTGACLVAAGVAAAGVVLAAFALPSRPGIAETRAQPAPGIGPEPVGGTARADLPAQLDDQGVRTSRAAAPAT